MGFVVTFMVVLVMVLDTGNVTVTRETWKDAHNNKQAIYMASFFFMTIWSDLSDWPTSKTRSLSKNKQEQDLSNLSRRMSKPTKWLCAQRRLKSALAAAQSDQSSLCAHWVAKDPSFLHAECEDSGQTGRMPMPSLIWIFAGRTCHFVLPWISY